MIVIGFAVYQLALVPGQSEPNSSGTPASRNVLNAYAHFERVADAFLHPAHVVDGVVWLHFGDDAQASCSAARRPRCG